MDTMTSFSYICIVWITICVDPLSAEPEFNISGHVGSTALLPCEMQRVVLGTPYIIWRIESEAVFERLGEEARQGVRYKERVDVPVEELVKGNCSLVLRNLTLHDAALHRSYQIVRHNEGSGMTKTVDISRVYLSVDGDAEMTSPHPLIMVLSLISYLLVQLFYGET